MKPQTSLWTSLVLMSFLSPVVAQGIDSGIEGPAAPEPPQVIARDDNGGVTVRAVRIPEPVVLDGALDDPYYAQTPPLDGFLQQEPLEGQPATEKTAAWVFFDDKNLYVSARMWDSEPERRVANEMRRDHFNISRGASFTVTLDTMYDRRNGFYFETNPLGAIRDGLITNETDLNTDWNTVWNAKATQLADGWSVEIAIPFRSLRFREGVSQVWGIQLKRQVTWKNEDSFLTRVPAAWSWRGVRKLSSAATLVGLETPSGSKNLEVKPFGITGVTTDRSVTPSVENDFTADVGFDAKYGVTNSMTADFTVNTDFAQVEADEQQVNLTRFSLFFPEKREFFLEGQGIFAFGGESGAGFQWGSGSYTPIMFFSRRIGIMGGDPTPIRAGGRLTGRAGKYTIGLLNIQTGEKENVAQATNFSVVRVRRDIFSRSNVGMIFTNRSVAVETTGSNQLLGADANFAFFDNLLINGYYAESRTEGLAGNNRSYLAKVENNGDRYGAEVQHLMVGGDFNPEVGFVRRRDFRRNFGRAYFSPRPVSIESVRKFRFGVEADFFHNFAGQLQTRELGGEFGIEFERGDEAGVEFTSSHEFLDFPFEIVDGVVIPVGEYDFERVEASYELGTQRRVSGRLSLEAGGFFGGNRTEASYWGRVEVTPQVSVEPSISLNWVDLPQGRFTTELVRARVNYTVTPRMFVSGLVQYNSEANSVGINARFRWEYEPGSDFFLVYSDGRDTRFGGFPSLVNRGLVVKFTKLVRF